MKPIYPGMAARLADGAIVPVTDVLIDSRHHLTRYLVLSVRGYFGPDVIVPFSAVWRVDDAAHLTLTSSDLATLPQFNHVEHGHDAGLCSRSAWRYGASRPRHTRPADAQ